ncbi:C6 zinc finger domain protein [Beauveria bassiana ARSEF 2860]|uniref:C6 zinc finger domain protein n=1 Tax=Beauveria bassiana (strain ARSEF 2860) TaxID=655819 RepID=J5JLA6_BEAB2|nr:C6 zinc finger domain protein [Beauveria bassiana ARSEF 2860]EJP66153.1 C6 zinc finger domain protein [Beauveria bassiana ARSEF 2860]
MGKTWPAADEAAAAGTEKRRRRGGTRKKTGCYTCKARHARCDEARPLCGNCQRLNLECRPREFIILSSWSAPGETAETAAESAPSGTSHLLQSNSASSFREHTSPITPTSTWNLFETYSPVPALDEGQTGFASSYSTTSYSNSGQFTLTAEMAYLLNAYRTGVATWMDIFDHEYTYQREVLRRCMGSQLLVWSVCAFTAKNLSLLPSGGVWAPSAAQYYSASLRLLIGYVGGGGAHEDTLTSTMLLCSYEMIANHGVEHRRHFYGAMLLISNRRITATSDAMDRANFWIYIRHEITVALVNETPLQIGPEEWNASWQQPGGDEAALGNQLLWLLGRAINLAYRPSLNAIEGRREVLRDADKWFEALPPCFRGVKYSDPDDHGFVKLYFAVPTAVHVSKIEYHALEIGSIGLSDIPACVRSFSAQAVFFGTSQQSSPLSVSQFTVWTNYPTQIELI